MKNALSLAQVAVTLASLAALSGCELLQQAGQNLPATLVDDLKPEVTVDEPTLRHGPSLEQLGAYYCPKVIGDPITRMGCAIGLGSPPPKSHLSFEFGVTIHIHNPNDVPIPALDILLALTLFDGLDAEELGAICVSMCGEDDPACDGTPQPGACASEETDIASLDDFIDRLPGLIADIITGEALEELKKSTIAAGGDVILDLSFTLGVDQALGVFEKTALAYVQDLLAGRTPHLSVPVAASGSVFVRVPALGRVGVNYGPIQGTWEVY